MRRFAVTRGTVAAFLAAGVLLAAWGAIPAAENEKNDPTVEAAGDQTRIAEGHNLLQETAAGDASLWVGQTFGQLHFRDVQGKSHYLTDLRADGPAVFVFMSTKCPLVKRYTGRLSRLHDELAEKGMSLVGVFSNEDDTRAMIEEYCQLVKFPFPVVDDAAGYLAQRLGATMTPQALAIDRQGVLRYRGGIDDHRYENRVKQRWLHAAVTSLLADEPVEVAESSALGCTLHLPELADEEKVTYSRHVARIVQDNCQSCHRPGQVAPIALTNYEETRTWATELQAYTQSRLMPPWKAKRGFGHFKDDRSLTDAEIALVTRWVEQGTPQGDPKLAPPAPRYAEQWALGEPDLIVQMPEEYVIGPEGEDDYRHFIIPTDFEEDVYVEAVDVQPGNRQTVHHVIVFTDNSGKARERDEADPGPGYSNFGGPGFEPSSMVGGWAPGTMPTKMPARTGSLLPKGADVVLQVHYYRTGVEERDRTRVGLYFSKSPKPANVFTAAVINTKFKIPPGEKRYEVEAEWAAPVDLYSVAVYPHMHLLGQEMKVTATLPDGQELPMIWIEKWDFNWQGYYFFDSPMLLPKGTKVQVVSYFDNSAENPNNPHDPPQPVGWGEKTTDEMCIAFLFCVSAEQYRPEETADSDSARLSEDATKLK